MRDPYQAGDQARETEISRLLSRIDELERMPDEAPAPPELRELLAAPGGTWRTGWVPVADRRLLVAVGGPARAATAAGVYGYLSAEEPTAASTGRVGPVVRRALPRPLAGYTGDDLPVVLADWLAGGDARRVLRLLRGGRGGRRLLSLAAFPALLAFRGHLSVSSALPPVLAPATGTVTTAMAAVAPLATAAAIATSPTVLPSVEAWIAPPAHELAVAHAVPTADDTELLTALPGHGQRRPRSGDLLTGAQVAPATPAAEKDAVPAPPAAAAPPEPSGPSVPVTAPTTPPVDESGGAPPAAPADPPPHPAEDGAQPPAQTTPPMTEPTGPAEPEQPTGDTPAGPPASGPGADPEPEPSAPTVPEAPTDDPAPTQAAPTPPGASTPIAVLDDGEPAAPPTDDPDDRDPGPTPELDAE